MLAQPFNGPPMHGAANTFIAALVRHAVGLYFTFGTRLPEDPDSLARMATDEIQDLASGVSDDLLALYNELGRSCSPDVASDLLDALEDELDQRDLEDDETDALERGINAKISVLRKIIPSGLAWAS